MAAARSLALLVLAALALFAAAPAGAAQRAPSTPAQLEVQSADADSAVVAWRASAGATRYRVTVNGTVATTTGLLRAALDGLLCGRSYRIGVSAVDAAGNRSGESVVQGSTRSCRPPEPQGLHVTSVTRTTISVDWENAPSSAHVILYVLYRNGKPAGITLLRSSFTFTGLTCGTTYVLGVDAVDIFGRFSDRATVEGTTAPCADATPPSKPGNLSATTTKESASLTWDASTDNVGVTGYVVDRDGVDIATTTSTTYEDDTVACGTTYTYGVRAKDAAGNFSERATVQAPTSPCVAPANLYVAPGGSDFQWTHLAVIYDGTTLSLYVNGALAATHGVSGPIRQSGGPLLIGGNTDPQEWFAGLVDDVRVYNRPLSATELQHDMATPVQPMSPSASADIGLVAAFNFDGNTDDASGSGPGATRNGANETSAGKHGGALSFNGSGDYASVEDSPSLDLIAGMTLEAWVLPDKLGSDWRAVLLKQDAGNLVYALYANSEDGSTGEFAPSGHVNVAAGESWARGGSIPVNTCTDPAAPCKTFDHAYRMAQPGQVVEAAGGSYGDQSITYDDTKTSDRDVLFRPASGASVTLGSLIFGESMSERGASHATFQDMHLTGDIAIVSCGADPGQQCQPDATAGGDDLTFRNLRVEGSVGFYCASCSNVSILGGVVGPQTYASPCTGDKHPEVQNLADSAVPGERKLRRAHDLLVDGVTFQNYAQCASGEHTECLQVEPADNVTIRNSTFRRCDTITVNFANDLAGESRSPSGEAAPDNVLIENNFFDRARSNAGDETFYALNIRECTRCIVRYNSWTQPPRMPDTGVSIGNFYYGNVGPFNQDKCSLLGVEYAFNVWVGAQCSPTDRNVTDPGFVDAENVDLHLVAGSPAIDAGDPVRHPSRDIDGDTRTGIPDAGADERR